VISSSVEVRGVTDGVSRSQQNTWSGRIDGQRLSTGFGPSPRRPSFLLR
jgi:hypothetical protein